MGIERTDAELQRRKNYTLAIGVIFLICLLALACFPLNYLLPDPNEINVRHRLLPPSLEHPFGTDHFGRDVFSRVFYGVRPAVIVGLLVVGISSTGGLLLGGWAGLRGGWLDEVIMRLTDAMMAFPGLLLAVAVISVLGPGLVNVGIAVGIGNMPVFARLVRGEFLRLREQDFIEAARAVGAREGRIIRVHLLPNALGPLLVQMTVAFATAVLAEAALSYLGLGTQPPDPSWGRMLKEAQLYMGRAPWLAVAPGAALMATILGINLLGDGLRTFYSRMG